MREVSRRVRTLIVPYLGWLAILGSVFLIAAAVEGAGPMELAKHVARLAWGGEKSTRPFTAFWFLTAIFFATVAYRFLVRRKPVVYALGLAGALAAATFAGPEMASLPLGIGVGFCSILFLAAGHALRRVPDQLSAWAGAAFLLCGLAPAMLGWSSRMVLKIGDFGTPVLSMAAAASISAGAILLAKAARDRLPRALGTVVSTVVSMSTPIILLHAVPLWLFEGVDVPEWALFAAGLVLPIAVGGALLLVGGKTRRLLMPGPPRPLV